MAQWNAEEATRLAEEVRREELKRKKAEEEAARQALRRETAETRVFAGALSSKNKADLLDITHALKLPMDGTKADLSKAISDHLHTHPALEADPRFAQLFSRRTRGSKCTLPPDISNENASPSPTRRRLDEPPLADKPTLPSTPRRHRQNVAPLTPSRSRVNSTSPLPLHATRSPRPETVFMPTQVMIDPELLRPRTPTNSSHPTLSPSRLHPSFHFNLPGPPSSSNWAQYLTNSLTNGTFRYTTSGSSNLLPDDN
ncbi:hypothetical protein BV25DRAFT_1816311 [Artomyces pyxidatus]|uniref:Uncharacterized protein n=1 Tax=Artomyces pyxidatus TaxID=48021 RepID=A0ACB8SES6_9AGAM|nr:hypothetical protein BV25DRAFT_1816311 [Artomyces pyxidatus]